MTKNQTKPLRGHRWQDQRDWKGRTIAGMRIISFVERVITENRVRDGRRIEQPCRDDLVTGYCECNPKVPRSMQLGKMKALHKQNKLFPCSLCRKRGTTPRPQYVRVGVGISAQTIARLNKLPSVVREKVDEIVRAHYRARLKLNTPEENPDRLYIEAIEIAELEARSPLLTVVDPVLLEPFRRYGQYVSPKDLAA